MLVFEVAEGLVIKEHAGSPDYVTIYVMDESVYAAGVNIPRKVALDTISKPPCEYTWNEMKDYFRTLQGMLAVTI